MSASPDPAKSEQNGAGGSAKPDYYNEFGKYLEQPVPGAPQPAVPEEKKMPFSGVKPAGSWSPERKWKTVSVDQSGTVATKPKDDFGYVQTTEMVSKGVRTWKLKISKKVGDYLLIGVSAPGIKADSTGHTCRDPSSFCIRSNGVVYIAGEMISKDAFPPTSITQPDLFAQRGAYDKLFTEGDEVAVTVNCHSHKLRLQTPTVDHAISLPKKSFWQSDKQWVLNVNFWTGDFEVKLM